LVYEEPIDGCWRRRLWWRGIGLWWRGIGLVTDDRAMEVLGVERVWAPQIGGI